MKLGQQMKLAPRMIQSMEILQMSLAELEERIEQELSSNPTLEQADRGGIIGAVQLRCRAGKPGTGGKQHQHRNRRRRARRRARWRSTDPDRQYPGERVGDTGGARSAAAGSGADRRSRAGADASREIAARPRPEAGSRSREERKSGQDILSTPSAAQNRSAAQAGPAHRGSAPVPGYRAIAQGPGARRLP